MIHDLSSSKNPIIKKSNIDTCDYRFQDFVLSLIMDFWKKENGLLTNLYDMLIYLVQNLVVINTLKAPDARNLPLRLPRY
jgi:hypothetical protein